MKLVKSLVAAATFAVASFSTQASTINIGGVNWDPSGAFDFSAETSESFFQKFDSATSTLTGYGKIVTVQGNANYCATCDLLFKFTATLSAAPFKESDASGPLASFFPNSKLAVGEVRNTLSTWTFDFAPTVVNIFSAAKGSFNGTLASVAGAAWLNMDLSGLTASAVFKNTDVTFANPLYGISSGYLAAKADGALASNVFVSSPMNSVGSVNSTFGSRSGGSTQAGFKDLSNLNILADTATVSAPSTLAVLGLGLLGLAGVARRKKSA